jgi:hypothetical protein
MTITASGHKRSQGFVWHPVTKKALFVLIDPLLPLLMNGANLLPTGAGGQVVEIIEGGGHDIQLAILRFNGHKRDEIEPLKEWFDAAEPGAHQQLSIFFDGKGDEDVFQGLSLFGDFQFRIAPIPFELVIDVNEFPVQQRVMGNFLFTEDKDAARPQLPEQLLNKGRSPQGPDELQGIIEHKGPDRGVSDGVKLQFGDILGEKGDAVLFRERFCLQAGLVEHGRGVVNPKETQILVGQQANELQQGTAGGATQINNDIIGLGKGGQKLGNPLDGFLVKRDGAIQHVIKDFNHPFREDKVFLNLVNGEQGVFTVWGGRGHENEAVRVKKLKKSAGR